MVLSTAPDGRHQGNYVRHVALGSGNTQLTPLNRCRTQLSRRQRYQDSDDDKDDEEEEAFMTAALGIVDVRSIVDHN
jgi:hypothetical protein